MKLVGTVSRFVVQTLELGGESPTPFAEVTVDLDLLPRQAIRVVLVRGTQLYTGVTVGMVYCSKSATDMETMSRAKYLQFYEGSAISTAPRPFQFGVETGLSNVGFLTDRVGTALFVGFAAFGGTGTLVFDVEIVVNVYDLTADEYIATL